MKVHELMTSPVESCHPDANLAEVASIMWRCDCGVVPVVDPDSGKVTGMITDRDITISLATRLKVANEIRAGMVVTGGVYACSPDDDVLDAMETMRLYKVRRLPVTDADGRLIGIVSLNDLVLRAGATRGKGAKGIAYRDVMELMQSICNHRLEPASAG